MQPTEDRHACCHVISGGQRPPSLPAELRTVVPLAAHAAQLLTMRIRMYSSPPYPAFPRLQQSAMHTASPDQRACRDKRLSNTCTLSFPAPETRRTRAACVCTVPPVAGVNGSRVPYLCVPAAAVCRPSPQRHIHNHSFECRSFPLLTAFQRPCFMNPKLYVLCRH